MAGKSEQAFRTIGELADELGIPNISCAIGRRVSRSCARCSAPAIAAITAPKTSRLPGASTAC
jgi:hypothetical protein